MASLPEIDPFNVLAEPQQLKWSEQFVSRVPLLDKLDEINRLIVINRVARMLAATELVLTGSAVNESCAFTYGCDFESGAIKTIVVIGDNTEEGIAYDLRFMDTQDVIDLAA